jgi:hypothetical protein
MNFDVRLRTNSQTNIQYACEFITYNEIQDSGIIIRYDLMYCLNYNV